MKFPKRTIIVHRCGWKEKEEEEKKNFHLIPNLRYKSENKGKNRTGASFKWKVKISSKGLAKMIKSYR